MQRNAGGFVRDLCSGPWGVPRDGSGILPRACDLPLLLAALVYTLVINPVIFIIVVLVPVMELMEVYFGSGMRASFCVAPPDFNFAQLQEVLRNWSPLVSLEYCAAGMAGLAFLSFIVEIAMMRSRKSKSRRGGVHLGLLLANGAKCFLVRGTVFLAIAISLVYVVMMAQWFVYSGNSTQSNMRLRWCKHYVTSDGVDIDGHTANMRCTKIQNGYRWFQDPDLLEDLNRMKSDEIQQPMTNNLPSNWRTKSSVGSGFFLFSSKALLAGLLLSFVLLPFNTALFRFVVSVAGPFLVFMLVAVATQFRIFAPLTGQLLWNTFDFDLVTWYWFVGCCMIAAFVVVPLQPELRSFWHRYYRRSIQLNFFNRGEDITWRSMQENPWCPFIVLTGTVNDYKRSGEKRSISEVSFSALHVGSARTGYSPMPVWQSLARCTALTAAACLDAITLSMRNHIKFRFWLEMLNLTWGDYFIFRQHNWAPMINCQNEALAREVDWLLLRVPTLVVYFVFQVLQNLGFHHSRLSADCRTARKYFDASLVVFLVMFMTSFFTFLRCFACLAYDPLLRRIHEATRYHYRGTAPPSLLYVTDGGVQDCTAIVQLMRRRRQGILLVLAADDPADELKVLRAAMDVALNEHLGCFFDPDNERRDVRILLEEFRCRKDWSYFELGIRYGWDYDVEQEALGCLVVVKNRLPTGYEQQPCRPLLTEELVRGETDPDDDVLDPDDPLAKTLQVELGGIGCCGCCHKRGLNCGRKFPHLTATGYLWLTPELFGGLCRLGRATSGEGVRALRRRLRSLRLAEQGRCGGAGVSPLH